MLSKSVAVVLERGAHDVEDVFGFVDGHRGDLETALIKQLAVVFPNRQGIFRESAQVALGQRHGLKANAGRFAYPGG